MCRLALLNSEGVKLIENQKGGLLSLLDYLESSQGGHGNGYMYITKEGKGKVRKGLKLSNKAIVKDVLSQGDNIRFFMYHTRLASKGEKTNKNCHPFKLGKTVICMNGTEYTMNNWIKDDDTDTETILKLCKALKLGVRETVSRHFNSVFLGFEDEKFFASKGFGSLELITDNEAVVFASKFPTQYKKDLVVYTAMKSWMEGQKINIKKLNRVKTVKAERTYSQNLSAGTYYQENYYAQRDEYNFGSYYNRTKIAKRGKRII